MRIGYDISKSWSVPLAHFKILLKGKCNKIKRTNAKLIFYKEKVIGPGMNENKDWWVFAWNSIASSQNTSVKSKCAGLFVCRISNSL